MVVSEDCNKDDYQEITGYLDLFLIVMYLWIIFKIYDTFFNTMYKTDVWRNTLVKIFYFLALTTTVTSIISSASWAIVGFQN